MNAVFAKSKMKTTSNLVISLGVLVTSLGKFVGGGLGRGLTGFGLAHIVLGTLDKYRPTVRGR